MKRILTSRWTKVVVFLVCLIPAAQLAWGVYLGIFHNPPQNTLGSNPLQTLEHTTGDWTLRFLCITLAITPLRKLLRLPDLIRFRRMMGLFAFFYVVAHFCIYVGLDQVFDFHGILADIGKRPYITVGFAGFVLLIPLAITSTSGMIRRLGGKNWQRLHRLIYITAILGVIHFWWLVKSDIREPALYAVIVGGLLAWRLVLWMMNRQKPTARGVSRKAPAPALTQN